jgi:DNA-binding NtrC family response regulator
VTSISKPGLAQVWIVDDERELADTYAEYLSTSYSTRCFYKAADALHALEAAPIHWPSVIVMDLRMPGIDGLSLLEQLRGKNIKAPVILISGFIEKNIQIEATKCGVFAFLEKPFHPLVLRTEIEKALGIQG